MQPVTPAPEIPNDVARALHLSDSPDLFRYVQRHRLVLPQAFLHDVGIVGS